LLGAAEATREAAEGTGTAAEAKGEAGEATGEAGEATGEAVEATGGASGKFIPQQMATMAWAHVSAGDPKPNPYSYPSP